MMKTLVTGSTGLLGSHIVEALLEQGHEVRALARVTSNISHLKTTGAEIVFGDIEDYDSLRPAVEGVDLVFHAAARVTPGWGVWEEFEACIVKGTENMLRVSAEAGVSRFLYVSSADIYGKAHSRDTPADEATSPELAFNLDTYYHWAKLQAEQLALDYHKQGKLPVTVIRPSMIYGPRDRLLTDRFFGLVNNPIVMWPGKSNPRSALVFASDVADCAILAATSDRTVGQVYNIAPPEERRFRDFAAALARAMGKSERQWNIPLGLVYAVAALMEWWAKLRRAKKMPFLTRTDLRLFEDGMYIDGSKFRREMGWEPKVSMDEGTRLYVQWRRSQRKK